MKHPVIRLARLVMWGLPLALVAGCPVDTTLIPDGESLAGTYWVEYYDGQLAAYELPAYRGEEGVWRTLESDLPEWYTGPALYDVRADGTWRRLTDDPELTLDDVLQTHDPGPRPPAASELDS